MNPTVPTITGTVIPTTRIQGVLSLHEIPAEDPKHLPRHDREHEQDRDRRRERPAGHRLVQVVEPIALAAVVQVRDERAERQRDRRKEQEQGLPGSQHRAVDPDLGRRLVAAAARQDRQDEEVRPEDQLAEQRRRGAERSEAHERARGFLRYPIAGELVRETA
jgi:hypothetical protein